MVERVKISPSQILLRNIDGSISFNTDNYYLKTDPTGNLQAGGYLSAPTIYGQNTITNTDLGWYNTGIISGPCLIGEYAQWNPSLAIPMPKYDSIKIIYTTANYNNLYSGPYYTFQSPEQLAYINNVLVATYRWQISRRIDTDSYGVIINDWNPFITLNVTFAATNLYNGILDFAASSTSMWDWTRKAAPYDYYSSTYRNSETTGPLAPFIIMTTSNPIALSISVTP